MQVIYNVTVSIDPSVEHDWVEWMRTKHIPEVMATGCFLESRISKMNNEEDDACTYAMTYIAYSQDDLTKYQREFAPALQVAHKQRYEGRFAAFRSTLNVLEHYTNVR